MSPDAQSGFDWAFGKWLAGWETTFIEIGVIVAAFGLIFLICCAVALFEEVLKWFKNWQWRRRRKKRE